MTILLLESLHADAEALLAAAGTVVRAADPNAPDTDFALLREEQSGKRSGALARKVFRRGEQTLQAEKAEQAVTCFERLTVFRSTNAFRWVWVPGTDLCWPRRSIRPELQASASASPTRTG